MEPLLAFTPALVDEPPGPFAVRCPCCGLRASLAALDDRAGCPGPCARCGGPCLGLLQREPAPAAPPLALRPVEDGNWVMRN
jgi:hypothetical protein